MQTFIEIPLTEAEKQLILEFCSLIMDEFSIEDLNNPKAKKVRIDDCSIEYMMNDLAYFYPEEEKAGRGDRMRQLIAHLEYHAEQAKHLTR